MTMLRTLGLSAPITTALDPTVWRKHYAFGLDLAAGGGSLGGFTQRYASMCGERASKKLATVIAQISDDTIRWWLRCALSELQVKLGIPLGVAIVKSPPLDDGLTQGVDYDVLMPRRPYTHGEAAHWYRIDVPGPILSVQRVRGYYYGQAVWEFSQSRDNIDLIRVEWPTEGSMHILPINFQTIIVTQTGQGGPGNYGVWHTLGAHRSPVPDFWSVDYTKGPVEKETGNPAELELVLINWCMCVAGQNILSMAGLAKSQGITSSSLSMDGLSRSIGLTTGELHSIYGALEEALHRAEERIDWKQLRKYKRGLRVRMLSW